jgi:integrase
MKLTDKELKNARPQARPYKLYDGGGLHVLVKPNGTRCWRYDYRYGGKAKTLALGIYPEVSLKHARDDHARARLALRDGIDPSAAKQEIRQERVERADNTFEAMARQWFEKQKKIWSASTAEKELQRLETYLLPSLGRKPFLEVKRADLLECLLRIERKGRGDTAHRVHRMLQGIYRYAIAKLGLEHDLTATLKGALAKVKTQHFPSITDPNRIGELLRALPTYRGSDTVRLALQLSPLLFARPGELRLARWEEFEFDLEPVKLGQKSRHEFQQWRIPAQRMKMKEQHLVPLSTQAVALLRELHQHTGDRGPRGLVLAGAKDPTRPISDNTVNAALARLDFGNELVGHGFRHMASTLLNERGFNGDWIERQLAHGERDSSRAAYNFAEYLPQRRKMMQAWADYLDTLAAGDRGKVVPFTRRG